jgi:hypothetical protein
MSVVAIRSKSPEQHAGKHLAVYGRTTALTRPSKDRAVSTDVARDPAILAPPRIGVERADDDLAIRMTEHDENDEDGPERIRLSDANRLDLPLPDAALRGDPEAAASSPILTG